MFLLDSVPREQGSYLVFFIFNEFCPWSHSKLAAELTPGPKSSLALNELTI